MNPSGAHNIACGLDADIDVVIEGHAGYYCAGMNQHATVRVTGNAGQGVAENMMSGRVTVDGNASQAAGATAHGGLLHIRGDASARCGISLKGASIVVEGSIGHMSAFMAQTGTIVVLGDAGDALGDSMYETHIYVRGTVAGLGADCIAEGARRLPPRRAGRPARGGRRDRRRRRRLPALRLGPQPVHLQDRQRVLMGDSGWHPGLRESHLFDRTTIAEIQRAAREGIYDIRGFGAKRRLPHFDDLLFLGASVSRYPLEGYRERCGTDVVLGARHAKKPLHLKIPITIAGMSFGALSGPAKEALGRGASEVGTSTTTGDGGMTQEERGHSEQLVYQLLPSRYGMNPDDLRKADAIEVVIGQGAKPGGGGMLLGHKISDRVAAMRDLPKGIDQRSASPAPRLDRPGRPRDQDPRAARDHRLAEADLRQGRRHPHLLRRAAGREGRRRRGGRRRHAGRHRRDPGRVHRARRHPDAAGHPAGRAGAPGARPAPRGAADRLGRHPHRRRRGEGARTRCRRRLDRRRAR